MPKAPERLGAGHILRVGLELIDAVATSAIILLEPFNSRPRPAIFVCARKGRLMGFDSKSL
jgi:hypothetical protein